MGLKQHDGISVPETPIIHKQDLQHKELLVCYPQEKAKPAESSIGKKIKRALFMTQKKHLQCKCFFMVRVTGLEPARWEHKILNLARLPIPPYPHIPH